MTFIPTIAKAIAAFVTPFIVLGLAWVIEQSGADISFDATVIETMVVAAVTAFATWLIANRPPRD